jgi:DmsE family decaheme c-type cytochrome
MKKILTFLVFLSALITTGLLIYPLTVQGAKPGGNTETCKACHKTHYDSYKASIHSNMGIRKSPGNAEGCESCHGPGISHIQKGGAKGIDIFIFGKRQSVPADKSAKCLECHAESRSLVHWDMGKHKSADVSCDSCHTVHSGKKMNLKSPQPELCLSCHRDLRGQLAKQSHHPVPEGKMKCTSCHDKHGGLGQKMIAAGSVNELCYKCHAEKRGPFLWEHPPVEENCQTCHTAHGSNHGKLLTSRVPQLCQSCHDTGGHPGTMYNSFSTFQGTAPTNRMVARSCLNCHSEIHGSTGPSSRGKTMVR